MKKRAAFLFVVSVLPGTLFAKPSVLPIVNLEFYGGQAQFDGDESSFAGNGAWTLAPVIKLSDNNTLIPSYSGAIRRTVQVQELIGGGLLTQSSQDHVLNLKSVHRFSDSAWKGKLNFGYKKELLRETEDEGWGDGLFDYDKYTTGFEIEREGKRVRSFRTGLNYFMLRYPNFQSLSSEEFGSEISAGTDVLDLNAVDWLTGIDLGLWRRGYLRINTLVSPRFYTDATVVEETGVFSTTKRRDTYLWSALSLSHDFKAIKPRSLNLRNTGGLYTSFAVNDSNQNNYDVDQTQFNENYYSFTEMQIGPRWGMQFFKNWDMGLAYTYTQRRYADRPVQSAAGTYTSSKVNNEIQFYSANLGYQLFRGLALNTSVSYQVSKSNQKYEQTYKYNYDSANFFIGISYAN